MAGDRARSGWPIRGSSRDPGFDYLITGGVASVIYGDPRFTRHIDLILELREADAGGFLDAFSPDDFYRPPLEA